MPNHTVTVNSKLIDTCPNNTVLFLVIIILTNKNKKKTDFILLWTDKYICWSFFLQISQNVYVLVQMPIKIKVINLSIIQVVIFLWNKNIINKIYIYL